MTHAGNADEALRKLTAGLGYDLVFSDLVMPGERDGLDLARMIRERWPHVPVLLATGYSDAASRTRDEGYPLIMKPYQPGALVTAIQQATAGQNPSVLTNVIPLARGTK